MPDTFEDLSNLQFVTKLVNEKYNVRVPAFLDHHQWWNRWEIERFNSMEELLKPGMIFVDIGAFDGWQDAIISRFVGGGHNMVLIEPVAENWANIRATWNANDVATPLATCMGFISLGDPEAPIPAINPHRWPEGVDYSKLISVTKFKLLNEHAHNTPWTRLDVVANMIGAAPNAINVDVEGAELEVLKACEGILREYKPIVWVSIHQQFMKERFRTSPAELYDLMYEWGYEGDLIGIDHEEHHIFQKQ